MRSFLTIKLGARALLAIIGIVSSARADDPVPPPRNIGPKVITPQTKPTIVTQPGSLSKPSILPAIPETPMSTTPLAPYPGYGYGFEQGHLPPRLVYGPSTSPTEYPYYSHPLYGQTPAQVGIPSYRHPKPFSLHR